MERYMRDLVVRQAHHERLYITTTIEAHHERIRFITGDFWGVGESGLSETITLLEGFG